MSARDTLHAWVVAGSGIAADLVRWTDRSSVAGAATPPPRPATGPWISLNILTRTSGGRDWVTAAANPLNFTDKTIAAVSAAADTLTITGHGLATGDGPVRLKASISAPGGLATATDYWVIRVDADTVKLAATFLQAIDSPTPIDITSSGAGVLLIASTADTRTAGAEALVTTHGVRTGTLSVQCYGGTAPDEVLERLRASAALPSNLLALAAGGVGLGDLSPVQDLGGILQPGTREPRAVLTVRFHVAATELSEAATVIETVVATGTVT